MWLSSLFSPKNTWAIKSPLTWTSKPLVGGFSPTPDDEIPNIWKNNPNVPNHQPDIYIYDISRLDSIRFQWIVIYIYIIIYHYISLYIIIYHYISLYIIIYHYISLYIIIYYIITFIVDLPIKKWRHKHPLVSDFGVERSSMQLDRRVLAAG